MTVTSIAPVGKRKCRVSVDEGFAFVLYRGEARRYGIEEGGDLPEEAYRMIETEILNKRARERCLYLLQASDKTEGQIRRKLKDDGYPQPVIDRTVALLARYRYVDDRAFAMRYVEAGAARKSRRQLAYELRQKGVDGELAAEAIREAAPDEEAAIRQLVRKRTGDAQGLSREELCKLYGYLGRKGYSFEAIRRVLGEICMD